MVVVVEVVVVKVVVLLLMMNQRRMRRKRGRMHVETESHPAGSAGRQRAAAPSGSV